MKKQTVQVFVRQVYGRPAIYPANETGERFATLLGVKTFNHAQLQGIESLGFTIEQAIDPATRLPKAS